MLCYLVLSCTAREEQEQVSSEQRDLHVHLDDSVHREDSHHDEEGQGDGHAGDEDG